MSVIGSKSPRRTVNISCPADHRSPIDRRSSTSVARLLGNIKRRRGRLQRPQVIPFTPPQSPTARQIAAMKAGHQLGRDGAQNGGAHRNRGKTTGSEGQKSDIASVLRVSGRTRRGGKSAPAPNLRRKMNSCDRPKQRAIEVDTPEAVLNGSRESRAPAQRRCRRRRRDCPPPAATGR